MNPIETIGAVAGISREESLAIWERVKANHKALDSCDGPHDFRPVDDATDGRHQLLRKHRCVKCGGTIEHSDLHWYMRGLKHGSSDAIETQRILVNQP
jgi:hypothetical protein